jgi:hypothetical protein
VACSEIYSRAQSNRWPISKTTAKPTVATRCGPLARPEEIRREFHSSADDRVSSSQRGSRLHDGPVRVLVISTMVCPDVWCCRTATRCSCSAHAWWGRLVGDAFPRASAFDQGECVAVARPARVEVLERRRSSASADVLDGLGYWR